MSEFRHVGKIDDFPEGRGRAVDVDGVKVAVFRIGRQIRALKDACPHMGASLADGRIEEGRRVTCHMHGWTFELDDGICSQTRQNRAQVYAVRIEGDEVFLRPPPAPPARADDDDEWVVFDPNKHMKKKP